MSAFHWCYDVPCWCMPNARVVDAPEVKMTMTDTGQNFRDPDVVIRMDVDGKHVLGVIPLRALVDAVHDMTGRVSARAVEEAKTAAKTAAATSKPGTGGMVN